MKSMFVTAAVAALIVTGGAFAQTEQTRGQSRGTAQGGATVQQGGAVQGGATTGQGATQAPAQAPGGGAGACDPTLQDCPTEAAPPAPSGGAAQSPAAQDEPTEQTGEAGTQDADAAGQDGAQPQTGEGGEAQTGAAAGQQAGQPEPATAPAEITPQHTTIIRERIIERGDYDRVDIDIDINIGVAVPRTIALYPLPPEIIEIVPIYEGYLFCILADGTILIIHPVEYEIVYIIYA